MVQNWILDNFGLPKMAKIWYFDHMLVQKRPKFDILATFWSISSQFFVKLERILVRIGQISPFGQNWLQKIGQKFNFWSIKVQLGTFRKHQFAHFSMSEALGMANLWFFGQIVVKPSFFGQPTRNAVLIWQKICENA